MSRTFLAALLAALILLAVRASEASPLSVAAGEDITVTLASNASTGYSWDAIAKGPVSVDKGVYSAAPPLSSAPSALAGAPGLGVFHVHARGGGEASIRFTYRRSWSPNEPAAVWTLPLSVRKATGPTEVGADVFYVHPGDPIALSLVANPSTGFGWSRPHGLDGRVVRYDGAKYHPPSQARPGAAGRMELHFTAATAGETSTVLFYQRQGVEPARAHTLLIRVAK
jgi:predicted secreted protein